MDKFESINEPGKSRLTSATPAVATIPSRSPSIQAPSLPRRAASTTRA